MVALPPLPAPLGILGGYSPAVVRATASSRSVLAIGLLPFGQPPSRREPGVTKLFAGPEPGPLAAQVAPNPVSPDVMRSVAKAATHAAGSAHPSEPAPTGRGVDDRSPLSPSGPPPGRGVVAGSSSASGGGAASALWCAILVGFLAYAAQELRRHRIRLVLAGPVGFVSPQQRPG
jgi:hypothetical protein